MFLRLIRREIVVLYPVQMSEKKPFVLSLVSARNFGLIFNPFRNFSLVFSESYVLPQFLKGCAVC